MRVTEVIEAINEAVKTGKETPKLKQAIKAIRQGEVKYLFTWNNRNDAEAYASLTDVLYSGNPIEGESGDDMDLTIED